MLKNDNMDLTHSDTADSLAGEYLPNSKSTDLTIKPSASNLDHQQTTGNVHGSFPFTMFLEKPKKINFLSKSFPQTKFTYILNFSIF